MYAAIVVDTDAPGLRQPFTYRVPDALCAELQTGSCVVVPFGKQTAIGYVTGFSEGLPDGLDESVVREILATVSGDGAGIPGPVLETARFLSRNYFCDLAQAVLSVV
ncbi:MAG: primosomal protein N', partial [Akkermansiaceae bacterium]|nr:primosomal protein N' [Armatimonadota bacterium]